MSSGLQTSATGSRIILFPGLPTRAKQVKIAGFPIFLADIRPEMKLVWLSIVLLFVGSTWRLARILVKRRQRVEDRLSARRDRWEDREQGLFEKKPEESDGSSEQEA